MEPIVGTFLRTARNEARARSQRSGNPYLIDPPLYWGGRWRDAITKIGVGESGKVEGAYRFCGSHWVTFETTIDGTPITSQNFLDFIKQPRGWDDGGRPYILQCIHIDKTGHGWSGIHSATSRTKPPYPLGLVVNAGSNTSHHLGWDFTTNLYEHITWQSTPQKVYTPYELFLDLLYELNAMQTEVPLQAVRNRGISVSDKGLLSVDSFQAFLTVDNIWVEQVNM